MMNIKLLMMAVTVAFALSSCSESPENGWRAYGFIIG